MVDFGKASSSIRLGRINRLEYDSVEPMSAVRTGDGWWVLGMKGTFFP